jgi:hypothetical protein
MMVEMIILIYDYLETIVEIFDIVFVQMIIFVSRTNTLVINTLYCTYCKI